MWNYWGQHKVEGANKEFWSLGSPFCNKIKHRKYKSKLSPDHLVSSLVRARQLNQSRDGGRSENLGWRVVMWHDSSVFWSTKIWGVCASPAPPVPPYLLWITIQLSFQGLPAHLSRCGWLSCLTCSIFTDLFFAPSILWWKKLKLKFLCFAL